MSAPYKVFREAPSRGEFFPYFIKLLDGIVATSQDTRSTSAFGILCDSLTATPPSMNSAPTSEFLFDSLIEYSIVNKKHFTYEELKMLQKFFQHRVVYTERLGRKHKELFGEPWIENHVTSAVLQKFFQDKQCFRL